MKFYKTYDNETMEFVESYDIQELDDMYTDQGLATVCEDGRPTKWEFEF